MDAGDLLRINKLLLEEIGREAIARLICHTAGGNLSITITRVKVAEIKKTPRIISFGIVFPNECYIFK